MEQFISLSSITQRDTPGNSNHVAFDGMILPPFPPLMKNAQERLGALRDLDTRIDDILLVVYPKAGTHWTWEILNMLLQGRADYHKDRKENAFLELIPDLDMIEEVQSPRVLNTHLPFRWLPKKHRENGGKIVHVVRNPKDIAVSFFHHMKSTYDGVSEKSLLWQDYFDNHIFSSDQYYGGWFAYEKEFEKAKKKEERTSIHTLHYEDLKRFPGKVIRRLAEYLGTDVTDQLITDIIDKTSFTKLKEADKTKEHKAFIKAMYKTNESEQTRKKSFPNIYRKGESGDWKNHFTVAQNEIFDSVYAKEMENSDINVKFD